MTPPLHPPRQPWRRRRLVIAFGVWLAAMAACAVLIARTPFTADLSAFLPASPDPQQRLLIEQLQSGLPSRTLLLSIGGGEAAARAAASRELAAALAASGLFEQVHNGDRANWAALGSWLFEHRYALSPAVEPGRFTAAGLADAFADTLSWLGTPAGEGVKATLARDPTGETARIAEALIPARSPRLEAGVWAGRDGHSAILMAVVRAGGGDLDAMAAALDRMPAAFGPAAARGLTLRISGAPLFAVQSRAAIQSEVHWLAIAGTAVMSALLLVAFGSLPALALALLPVGTGVMTGIAAVALGFGSVHGMTLGFGTTLIGEGVDYAIYYLIQARAGAREAPGAGWRAWLASGWPTVRLGLLTSLCGFAALVFSGFPGLAQLGVFSIAGLLGAAAATRGLLPLVQPDGARGTRARSALGHAAGRLAGWLPRLRWPALAMCLGALAVVASRGDLWRADLAALSPLPAEVLALDASLREDLGASDARAMVVVQGADAEATLVRAEAVAARLDALVERGALGGYDSATRWLPSQARQAARRAALPPRDALATAVGEAAGRSPGGVDGPLSPARLAPFLDDVERARRAAPLTPASLQGTPAAPLVEALLLARADGSYAALVPLQPPVAAPREAPRETPLRPGAAEPAAATAAAGAATIDLTAVQAALAGADGAHLLDLKSELDSLYRRYLREALLLALAGAAAVVALMAPVLRSARRMLAVCQPLAGAVLLVLAGLAAFGVPLGILHLVGLLLVVAVGSNYALFFDLLRHRPAAGPGADDHADLLASVLLANLTTVASFGLLALSAIPALSAIGRVVAPGALLALLLAATFARQAGANSAGRPRAV